MYKSLALPFALLVLAGGTEAFTSQCPVMRNSPHRVVVMQECYT
jgi:hypothetical protein